MRTSSTLHPHPRVSRIYCFGLPVAKARLGLCGLGFGVNVLMPPEACWWSWGLVCLAPGLSKSTWALNCVALGKAAPCPRGLLPQSHQSPTSLCDLRDANPVGRTLGRKSQGCPEIGREVSGHPALWLPDD